ncbi:hypothetical protein DMENIID0001_130970 [Sergentomyia squamirostris]
MRLVLILSLVAASLAASVGNFDEFVPENNSILDEVVARWLRGVIADLDDPHHIPQRIVEDFNFGNGLVTLRGFFLNVRVRGLRGIQVNRMNVDWSNLRFDFDITVPHLNFVADWYDLRGRFVNILPLFGNGPVTIDMWNLNVNGHCSLGIRNNGMLEMRAFRTRSRLQRFQTQFQNLLFGGEFGDLWNYIFSDMLPVIMENYHQEVTDIVEEFVTPRMNERLNSITRDDLWDIIHGRRSPWVNLLELGKSEPYEVDTERPEPYFGTEKPEPYFGTEKPEPYFGTEKPEPYFGTEKPEPYFRTEKPEPYFGTEKPEPYFDTEKPEPYFGTEKPEPYFGTEKPEPYFRTEKPEPYFGTEKPEPYFGTEKPEPYFGTEKPEPYFRTEKPEPYFRTEKPEPYFGTEKPEPYFRTEKPEPYFGTEKPEPYFGTEKPEPYFGTEKPEPYFRTEKPEPYFRTEKPEPYFGTEKPEPYFGTEKPEPYFDTEKPEPYFVPIDAANMEIKKPTWITFINVKNIK